MHSRHLLLMISVVVALHGCGEDQSQPQQNTAPVITPPATNVGNNYDGSDALRIVGTAMDGFLYQAWACLDANGNQACDGDEFRSKTDRQGRYVLQVPAGSAVDEVIVEVIPGTTIDMDFPQQPLQQRVVLRPLPGDAGGQAANQSSEQLVTPLTTLIRQRAERSGLPVEEVQQQLAREWLVPAHSLTSHYLQDVDGHEDQVVHDIAQVVMAAWQHQLQLASQQNPGAAWQQVVAAADAQWHSQSGQKQLRSAVQTRDMAPAPELIINDDDDLLSWHWVEGFTQSDAYEYSLDGGQNWLIAAQKPLLIGNQALAAGQVQLRVRSGSDGGAGRIARNLQAFTARISNIGAPQLWLDDSADEFGWQPVAGLAAAEEYEISLDGGQSWTQAQQNPTAYGDLELAAGQLQVRVRATAQRLAGAAAVSQQAFTRLRTDIAAPSELQVDDSNNTLGWRPVAGFASASLYEISTDGGYSWQAAQSNPAQLGDIDIAAGQAQVRVAAKAGEYAAGAAAAASEAYVAMIDNIAAPTQLQVDDQANLLDWALVPGFSQLADFQISFDGGTSWQTVNRKPVPVGDRYLPEGQVQLRVAAVAGQRQAGAVAYNQQAFQASPATIDAPAQLVVDDVNDTLNWQPVAGYPNAGDYQWRILGESGWRAITSRPLLVGDIAIAKGHLQLRVAESNAQRGGDIAFSPAAFTALDSAIGAPSALQVDDINNALSWTWVAGFEQAADYEYHLGDGLWRRASANPLAVGDVDVAKGALQLRVAAKAGLHRAGKTASSDAAFHAVVRNIAAPQGLLVDDIADTLNWQWVPGFAQPQDYQWSLDGGQNWSEVTQKPLPVGDRDIAANQLLLRVKDMIGLRDSGESAISPQAFHARQTDIAAPQGVVADDSADTLSWRWVSGFEQASDYEYSINGGVSWSTASQRPVKVGDIDAPAVQVLLRVKGIEGSRSPGASAAPESGFSRQAGTPGAPTGLRVNDSADTLDWVWVSGFEQAADYQYQWPGSQGWQPVSSKPLHLGNVAIASGQLLLRVAAQGAQAPGAIAVNHSPFTISAAGLPKPANLVVNDDNDTLQWDYVGGYEQPQDYQYRLAQDGEWQAVSTMPLQLSDRFAGVVSVRIGIDGAPQATTLAGDLTPTAFAKLDHSGRRLTADATDWACIRDNQFEGGLYWQKSSDDTLFWLYRDDTVEKRLTAANQASLCGFNDWQVAGIEQLLHLKDISAWGQAPFFDHLQTSIYRSYWSSDVGDSDDERKVIAAGNSRQIYSESRQGYNRNYMILNRLRVDPVFYIATVKEQLAAAVTETEKVKTWNQQARTAREDRQQEFTSASSVADIQFLQAKLLDSIKKQQDRYQLLPGIKAQHQQALTEAETRQQRLLDDPDNNVSPGQLLDYQQALQALQQQNELLLQAIEPQQQDGMAAVLVDLQSLLASLKKLTSELERWSETTEHHEAGTNQLQTGRDRAADIAAKLQALKEAGNDAEQARALYLAARQNYQDFADSQMHEKILQQDLAWLKKWHSELQSAHLPAAVLSDLQQQITALTETINEHQSWRLQQQALTDAALEGAYGAGLDISEAEASVKSGGHAFVKLDVHGRRMLASETFAQGWRCVQDLRYRDERLWMLLREGEKNSTDRMNYPEAQQWLAAANQQAYCGRKDWQLPSIKDLKTLKLADISAPQPALDEQVFVNHDGNEKVHISSDLMQRYFYWTQEAGEPGSQLAYSFAGYNDYQSVDEKQQGFNNSASLDNGYQIMTRLLAHTPTPAALVKLDVSGQATNNDSEWVCTQDQDSGLIWLRPEHAPQPEQARDIAQQQKELAYVQVCGSDQWRLPTLNELKGIFAYTQGELGAIRLPNNQYYASSSTTPDQYNNPKPAVFSFEAGRAHVANYYRDSYPLWVSEQKNGASPAMVDGFSGLDANGEVTLSGVHYCVRDDRHNLIWTTHLVTGDSQTEYGSPSNYCGFNKSRWQYPTFEQFQQALEAKDYLLKDWIQSGQYWLQKPGVSCQDNQWAVIDQNMIERCIDADDYYQRYPKESNYSRFIISNP